MNKHNNPERRIYSLNLIAYLELMTGKKAELYQDEENHAFYGLFTDSNTGKYMLQYRDLECQVNLHDYLQAFGDLRSRINTMRGVI